MLFSLIRGTPAFFLPKERLVVIGDTHIGKEILLEREGIFFPDASRKMAQNILKILRKKKAKGLVILGDVKESVGHPNKAESNAIASFFNVLNGIDIHIAKGNHDAHLGEILARQKYHVQISNEILLDKVALMHGHAMPTQEAMSKQLIIAGHSHIAVKKAGVIGKGWLETNIGPNARKYYKKINKKSKLVVIPAFSDLITGMEYDPKSARLMPMLRKNIFNPDKARLFNLNGERCQSLRK